MPTPPPPPRPRDKAPKRAPRGSRKTTVPNGPSVSEMVGEDPLEAGTGDTEGTEKEAPQPSFVNRQPGRKPPLQKKLEEFFASPSLVYSFMGDEWAAQLIATRTPMMAEAWYDLSTKNAGVKRVLERLVEGGAWGAVVLSTMAVALPLAQHHGALPGSDPFSAIYPPLPAVGERGPIVPPPPSEPSRHRTHREDDGRSGGAPTYIPGSPPGVVTVQPGVNNHAS